MPQILYMGLCLALFGSPLLMAFFKSIDANQFSPIPRFGLWVLALTLLCIAAKYFENWRAYFDFFFFGSHGRRWALPFLPRRLY
jgi:hypothetical protein